MNQPYREAEAMEDQRRMDWLEANRLLIPQVFRGCDGQRTPRKAIDEFMEHAQSKARERATGEARQR